MKSYNVSNAKNICFMYIFLFIYISHPKNFWKLLPFQEKHLKTFFNYLKEMMLPKVNILLLIKLKVVV